jgi:hypothetical protein
MLPSASTLAMLRREQNQRHAASKQVAVLADPVFDRDDPRVTRDSWNQTDTHGNQETLPKDALRGYRVRSMLERSASESGMLL